MASSSLNFDNTVAQIRSLSFSTAAPPNSALQSPAPLVLLRPFFAEILAQKFRRKSDMFTPEINMAGLKNGG